MKSALTINGQRLTVGGDLIVEPGGSIIGTQSRFDVIVHKNLDLQGSIQSAGHLVLVNDPALLPSDTELEAPLPDTVENSIGETSEPPPPGANPDPEAKVWTISGESIAGASLSARGSKVFQRQQTPPSQKGKNGRKTIIQLIFALGGQLIFQPPPGQPFRTVQVDNGAAGSDTVGCDVTGGDGRWRRIPGHSMGW